MRLICQAIFIHSHLGAAKPIATMTTKNRERMQNGWSDHNTWHLILDTSKFQSVEHDASQQTNAAKFNIISLCINIESKNYRQMNGKQKTSTQNNGANKKCINENEWQTERGRCGRWTTDNVSRSGRPSTVRTVECWSGCCYSTFFLSSFSFFLSLCCSLNRMEAQNEW